MKRRRNDPTLDDFARSSGLSDAQLRRGVNRLVEQARNMEGSSEPRKHHVVPASYLDRWSVDGRILQTDVNTGKAFPVSPRKAARDTDFYRVESEDLDRDLVPPLLFEKMLAEVEGAAVPAFDAAIDMDWIRFNRDAAVCLASFVAFQLARGHRYRARIQAIVNSGFVEMYRDVTEDGMRDHLGGTPHEDELKSAMSFVDELKTGGITVGQQQAAAVWQIGEAAQRCLPILLSRRWHVVSTGSELITTDEPVLLLAGPGWPRGQQPGLHTALIIAMPLSPNRLLVLASPDLVDSGQYDAPLNGFETDQINLELLANAHRWQFSTPSRRSALPLLPPPVPPWILERGISIAGEPGQELLHGFSPNRWLYADSTPWPVERWWTGQRRSYNASPTAFMHGQTVRIEPNSTNSQTRN
jgi:hypothetical protein